MAEAAPDHSAGIKTVDDLFQKLVIRKIPPLEAKKRITEALQIGELLIDSHVAAGARKESSRQHWANPEEPAQAPPGGITTPVDPQSWDGGVFALAIRDHHLVVEPRCSLDFPWQAYSFSIANPVVIPDVFELRSSTANTPDAERPPPDADKVTQIEWQYSRLVETGQLAGLRGKALLKRLCAEVGPNFSAGPTVLKEAKRRYRKKKTHSA
jgi:hypothetical protein